MPQAINGRLMLYADDSCVVFQHKDIEVIEKQLNKDFTNLCEWFVDNRLSIHFGDDKTKSILFSNKHNLKKGNQINIVYKNNIIKQHSKVPYLGCILDETLSGESMALKVIQKINKTEIFVSKK